MPRLVDQFYDGWRRCRHALKARLPWVRRRLYHRMDRRYLALLDAMACPAPLATEAGLHVLKSPEGPLTGEAAIFVSFAEGPVLKPYVACHLEHLLDAGFEVALVLNSDLPPERLQVAPALLARLRAAWVRPNVGFDFAGWAHAWARCDLAGCTRLLLVNDSIVGPTDTGAYRALLARLRACQADLIALTANPLPVPHLQSYFLALGPRALAAPAIRDFFAQIRSWPTKGLVIDHYELTLTERASRAGLSTEALFQAVGRDPRNTEDTTLRWEALLEAGFPFVKGSVLRSPKLGRRARALVPPALRLPEP
jgi:hypothetical protein